MAWRYGANPQVEFGSRSFVVSWTKKLTHKEYVNVVAAGVVMGLIPFIAFMPAHAASLGFEVWVALAMYVWSARKDIRVLAGGGV